MKKNKERAIVLWNDSNLSAEDFKELSCDYFYCLFNKSMLYVEDDCHFFVEEERPFSNKRFKESIKAREIDEVVFFSTDGEIHTLLKEQFEDYGIKTNFYEIGE